MVRFVLDGLEIFFPYEYVYPEQFFYMSYLKQCLDAGGHGVLEMPTGTGKTVTVFALVTSYQLANPTMEKFFFCTRTIAEMDKALVELRGVLKYRLDELIKDGDNERLARAQCLGLALSARRNLCVHPRVSREPDRDKIDESCRALTAPWVRRTKTLDFNEPSDIEDLDADTCQVCPWYENLDHFWNPALIPRDVYTMDDLKRFGSTGINPIDASKSARIPSAPCGMGDSDNESKVPKFCPYFAARRLVHSADIIVLNYQYVLDPKVTPVALGWGGLFGQKGQFLAGPNGTKVGSSALAAMTAVAKADDKKPACDPNVIVFDEAHNIDNVCIEALSINISCLDLERARANIKQLRDQIGRVQIEDRERLVQEYKRLVREASVTELRDQEYESFLEEHMASPLLPSDMKLLETAMPGSIRNADVFVIQLLKMVHYLDGYIRQFQVTSEGPLTFLTNMEKKIHIEAKTLKFYYERLKEMFISLRVVNMDQYLPLAKVADFCTLVGTYWKGFIIITDPYPEAPGIYNPVIQLCCLDPALAMKPVFERFRTVVLTSGTISPLSLYPKLLDFRPHVTQSFPMSLDRKCILPLVVSKGPDQVPLSSKFELREDLSVIRNYGRLLTEFAKIVPDGIVCFFTSYAYMEIVVSKWYESGVLANVMRYKLVLMETKDIVSTTLALANYRRCCDSGRGAIFFSVARGKVAEGIDFDRHYGRAVILFGVSFQYTLSRVLKSRLEYMRENHGVAENEFLSFDAMRQAAQCVGRVIRSKADYGLMIFADYRYGRPDKRLKIPEWIRHSMDPHHTSLSVDVAVAIAARFLLEMSQPYQMTMKSRLDSLAIQKLDRLIKAQRDKAATQARPPRMTDQWAEGAPGEMIKTTAIKEEEPMADIITAAPEYAKKEGYKPEVGAFQSETTPSRIPLSEVPLGDSLIIPEPAASPTEPSPVHLVQPKKPLKPVEPSDVEGRLDASGASSSAIEPPPSDLPTPNPQEPGVS